MKKGFNLFLFSLVIVSFLSIFASAAASTSVTQPIQSAGETVYEVFRPLLEKIIGQASDSDMFLAKVMFLAIIMMIVWIVLEQTDFFTKYTFVHWVVSIAVSILAIRWFGNSDIVQTALLPYSALGISIVCGIPFVIAFFVISKFRSRTSRKTAWIFFAVVFAFLWYGRQDVLGDFGNIYLITAGLAILALFFDGTIQKTMAKAKIERTQASYGSEIITDIRRKMRQNDEDYTRDIIDEARHKENEEKYRAKLDSLLKRYGSTSA